MTRQQTGQHGGISSSAIPATPDDGTRQKLGSVTTRSLYSVGMLGILLYEYDANHLRDMHKAIHGFGHDYIKCFVERYMPVRALRSSCNDILL